MATRPENKAAPDPNGRPDKESGFPVSYMPVATLKQDSISPEQAQESIREYQKHLQHKAARRKETAAAFASEIAKIIPIERQAPPPPSAHEQSGNFELTPIADKEIKPNDYLIHTIAERDSVTLIYGDPGSAKTFAALDMGCCVATGTSFHGRKVKQGPVIVILGEGYNGFLRRVEAWGKVNGVDIHNAPIFISEGPAALCDPFQTSRVKTAINTIAEKFGPPALIIIDTVARNFGPGDENSTKDMSAFIAAIDSIRTEHNSCMLLIHHTGHSDKTRARGSMALKGALDAEYRLSKDGSGLIRMECTKAKDFEPPPPMAFVLRTIDLSIRDEHGNTVTSAVLSDTSYEPKTQTGKTGHGRWQTVALEALNNLHAQRSTPFERVKIPIDDWRAACLSRGMNDRAFRRVKEQLPKIGMIQIEEDFINPAIK